MPKKSYYGSLFNPQKDQSRDTKKQVESLSRYDAQQAAKPNLQSLRTSNVTDHAFNNLNTSDRSDAYNDSAYDNTRPPKSHDLSNKDREEHFQYLFGMLQEQFKQNDNQNRNRQGQCMVNFDREDQLKEKPSADVITFQRQGIIDDINRHSSKSVNRIPHKSKAERHRRKVAETIKPENIDCISKKFKAGSPSRKKEARRMNGHSSKNLDRIPHKFARSPGKKEAKRINGHSSKSLCHIPHPAGPPKLIPIASTRHIRTKDSYISDLTATAETRPNMYLGRRPPTPYPQRLVSLEEEEKIVISDDNTSLDEFTAHNTIDIEAASSDHHNESSPEIFHFPLVNMASTPFGRVEACNIATPTPTINSIVTSPCPDFLSSISSSSPLDNEESASGFDMSINKALQHIDKLLVSKANMDSLNNKSVLDQQRDARSSKSRQPNQTKDQRFTAVARSVLDQYRDAPKSRPSRSRERRQPNQKRLKPAEEKISVLRQHRDKPYPTSKPNRSKQHRDSRRRSTAVEVPIASLDSKATRKSYNNFALAMNALSHGIPNLPPIKIDCASPTTELNRWWNDNCKHFYKSEEDAQKRYRFARAIIESGICRNVENPLENSSDNTSSNSSLEQVQSPPIITDQMLASPSPVRRPLPIVAIKRNQPELYDAQAHIISKHDFPEKVGKGNSGNREGSSILRHNTNLSPNYRSAFIPSPAVPRKRPVRRELFPDPPTDTCGVTLTREGYYTIPAVNDLAFHKSLDDRCVIEGFIVGRIDYGHVNFPEPIDVTGLNLDEIVHFEIGAITMYPDEDQRPPVGEGLNRPANVSLENVFPRTESGTEIRDVKTLLHMDYTRNLRLTCERNKTKFVSYIPENGSWIFTVEHFCTYGLKENDSNEEGNQAEGILAICKENLPRN